MPEIPDDLIDDEVRRSFPGSTDKEIYEFYLTVKAVEDIPRTSIFESDLSHAMIIRELGWAAFKEYLVVSTGTDWLDPDDFVALTNALTYLREIENITMYNAIYGASSEASSKKTVKARKKSFEQLASPLDNYVVDRGV